MRSNSTSRPSSIRSVPVIPFLHNWLQSCNTSRTEWQFWSERSEWLKLRHRSDWSVKRRCVVRLLARLLYLWKHVRRLKFYEIRTGHGKICSVRRISDWEESSSDRTWKVLSKLYDKTNLIDCARRSWQHKDCSWKSDCLSVHLAIRRIQILLRLIRINSHAQLQPLRISTPRIDCDCSRI